MRSAELEQKRRSFIDMNNFGERKIVHPRIRGVFETYLAIAPSRTISIDGMRIILGIN